MRALAIAWKDVRHVYRSIAGLAMMLVAPLLLAGAIGAAFGGGGMEFSISATKTVVVDLDGGAAGSALVSALSSEELADLLIVSTATDPAAARSAVDAGTAEVAVIIPAGLTQALSSATPSPLDVQIYKDPTVSIGPAIVNGVVQDLVQSLNGARAAASATAQLAVMQGITDSAQLTALATQAAQDFSQGAQSGGGLTVESRAPTTGDAGATQPNVAGQVLIGMMLFFSLFGAATPARSIIDEQREGTLSRLFTTPTPRSIILGGKYISVFLVVLLQTVILLVVGRFLFGSHWGAIGPVIVLVITGALVAASLGLLTVSYAKTPAQAGAGSAGIFVFLGLISGSFTGTANIGGAYEVARHISPLGWLIDGWNHTMYGGSWDGIALPVLVALGFAFVFFAVATFFFRRRFA